MKKQLFRRILCWLLVLCMVLPFVPVTQAASVSWEKTDLQLRPQRTDRQVREGDGTDRDSNEPVRVSIVLEAPSTVEAGYSTMGIAANTDAMAYRAQLLSGQKRMERTISARVLGGKPLDVVWNMTLVGNIISAWVPYGKVEAIKALPGVKTVALEARYEPCVTERVEDAVPNTYPSSSMTGSGVLWSGGYTGAGTRIAVVDTGTDTDHQSFDNGAYLHALAENAAAKGMSLTEYKASLDLLTREDIAALLPELHAYERMPGLTAELLYGNEKLAFGFNYVDANLTIVHDYDQQGEHGSHVAGITTANRYIPQSGGYADARDSVMMLGVAPDAQLITMKVFGESYPYDSDYMAAIEDAIVLDCDVVNLSMGTTMPGSPYTDVYRDLMELMTHTDTVVVISAGNASNWAVASTFGYLYSDDVSFDTVGAPGSYANAFTVASVDNDGAVGYYFTAAGKTCFYDENLGYGNTPFASLDRSPNQSGTEYEYVLLDGLGYPDDYEGLDVSGKVVMVSRGTLNFAEKANNAAARGAVAVVVYNNTDGMFGMDLTGLYYAMPVAGLLLSDAQAIAANSEKINDIAYTGKLTVYGRKGVGLNGSEYYTMSDFSSWGVPGSLALKPEITAPGGSIYSLWGSNAVTGGGSDRYEIMSGTSMAAPQVAGMAALLAQFYRENGLEERSGLSARHLAQSLLMSTAQPLYEEASGGNYYSLLNQGAGLARVDLAAQAQSYILVADQPDGKVKAELGDDPNRTGVYTFDFTINNLTDKPTAYTLDADLFRQDVFEYQPGSDIWLLDTWTVPLAADVTFRSASMGTGSEQSHDLNGDGVTDAADADYLLEYLLGNEPKLFADGDLSGDGQVNSYDAHLLLAGQNGQVLNVPAGGTATVSVELKLTEEAKAELDAETPNGTYVQAFVYARAVSDAEGSLGTTHSIPVLAFYGDWSDPSMFDRGTLMELVYMTTNTAPYLYQTIGFYGNALGIDYGDGMEYYYGGNPVLDDVTYLPERNAFNSVDASRLTEQSFTLIRGAGAARMQITDAKTGEVYFSRELGELYPAYYNPNSGQWENTIQYARLNWTGKDASGVPLAEGTVVNVSLTAVPHYYRRADGSYSYEDAGAGSTMTTTLTIDNTAPEALDVDVSRIDEDKLTVKAKDNRHVAAVALLNGAGTKMYTAVSPNQTKTNQAVAVELDLTDIYGSNFLLAVYDYAGNVSTYQISIDLGSPTREYFTAIDCNTMTYVGVKMDGSASYIADIGLPGPARAAEYVGGHVFMVTEDNSLCVANDEDLSSTERICRLDPRNELLITGVNDLAYNYADGKLYVQFYSQLNDQKTPYLATIDMRDGDLELVCQMPVDVNTMAIDSEGNFYSAGYASNILYTYTLEQITGEDPGMTYVGEMGYYESRYLSSMAWDHNEDRLYWAFPNILIEIDPRTAEPTLLGYQEQLLVGLYTRPDYDEGMFDPVDTVDRVELNLEESRILVGADYSLEAAVWPWNASDRTVTWTTSDASVATVDAAGNVRARSQGTCVITATSVLDPTKSASCTVSTFRLDKTLRGIIWDENGAVWMSEFSTGTLPDYTRLHSNSLDLNLAAATMGQDGNLYAASLDLDSLQSDLYRLDPVTFQPTLIGPSTDGYVDLAPAPGAPGNSLMAVYGSYVLHVDAESGDYYNWYNLFSNNLVGIAYVGTQAYNDWGYDTLLDWYFIIDRLGYVYLMGFMEQDGTYYYLEHDQLAPGGVYTKLDFEMDTPYFGSAWFDGEMLYYSAYKESQNNVTLMAIDVAGDTRACYELGTFADNVWPVAGLMEPGTVKNNIGAIMSADAVQPMGKPVPAEQQTELTGIREHHAEGSLNSTVQPMSHAESEKDQVRVTITTPAEGTNGVLTVTFDPAMLQLQDVQGRTDAFAWKQVEEGKVQIAFAEGSALSADASVALLKLRGLESGTAVITASWSEWNDGGIDYTFDMFVPVTVEKPHTHSYSASVTEPTCTEPGFTTYTCACGDSYVSDYIDALGHAYKNGICIRCGAVNNPFTDVPNDPGCFYRDPVLWAVENGITTGASATTFNPGGVCMRGHVVTFLWRAMGSPEPETTVNPFVDVKEQDYFYKAVLWAYENGITTGISASHFAPTGECNRAQVVTFLWRAMGRPESQTAVSFTDVKPDQFYTMPVAWAVENGITNGMGDGTFGVNTACNRAQVVTFLYRTLAK